MAYNKEDLIKKSLDAINKHKLVFIEEVITHLPCSPATFYNHKLEKIEAIKDAIELNKVAVKSDLRKKWQRSENATLQIALYKIVCSEEELRRLTNQTLSGDPKNKIEIVLKRE